MNEAEMIENLSSVVDSNTTEGVAETEPNTNSDYTIMIADAINIHDYVVSNIDKLVDGSLINDDIHHIDEEIDIQDSLIFNDKSNHKCVVIDIKNLYCPVQNYINEQLGDIVSMKCCQSGIIINYVNGRMYISKNNLFLIKQFDGKVSQIDTMYRAKNDIIKCHKQELPEHDCHDDIEMIKFSIKSRCVRIYNSIKDETDKNNIYTKLMDHYNKVVDINNLIKIEHLRFDIGC